MCVSMENVSLNHAPKFLTDEAAGIRALQTLIPHLQKILASDLLFSSAFSSNTRAIN